MQAIHKHIKTVDDFYPGLDSISVNVPVTSINGNPHVWEAQFILRMAARIKAKTIFEIGTGNGATAAALAWLPDVQQIWTLDLPVNVHPALDILEDDLKWIGMNKVGFPAYVLQLWGDSATFDFSPYETQCDLVFVMGSHSLTYIHNDLRIAERLVSHNGIIILHAGTSEIMECAKNSLNPDKWIRVGDRMAITQGNVRVKEVRENGLCD